MRSDWSIELGENKWKSLVSILVTSAQVQKCIDNADADDGDHDHDGDDDDDDDDVLLRMMVVANMAIVFKSFTCIPPGHVYMNWFVILP